MSTPATIEACDIVDLVNAQITEIGGRALPNATFEDVAIDSLVCLEMIVLLKRHFDVNLEEHEVMETASFQNLAHLVNERRGAGGERG